MKNKPRHSQKSLTRICYILTLVTVLVISCTQKTTKYRADHGVAPCEYTGPLNNLFGPLFPDNEPGAIVTVMRNDTIVYNHAFGLARLDSVEAITDSTLFNIASASKMFSAVALMKLSEQGLISLDDTLSKYFPEFTSDLFNRIRVGNIVAHPSGLPDLRPRDAKEWNEYIKKHKSIFSEMPDYRRYGSESEHIQIFAHLDSVDVTADNISRDDPAFLLVVPLIERVSGMSFDKWMAENIFKPAGMTETCYLNPNKYMARASHSYRRTDGPTHAGIFRSSDGKWEEYDYGEADFFLIKADRGAYSSARDLMRWIKALYSGKIITAESLAIINTPRHPTPRPHISYGLANAIEEIPGRTKKIFHLNSNGGYSVIEASIPDKKISYIVLATRSDWDKWSTTAKMDSILLDLK